MPSYIKKDFEPDEHTLNLLRQKGIFPDFLAAKVNDPFMLHWLDLKNKGLAAGKKTSWQKTYYNWAKKAWFDYGHAWEENRHKGRTYGGMRNDLFEQIADKVLNGGGAVVRYQTGKPPKVIDYTETLKRLEPQPGPAMSPEEAFAALRKII